MKMTTNIGKMIRLIVKITIMIIIEPVKIIMGMTIFITMIKIEMIVIIIMMITGEKRIIL